MKIDDLEAYAQNHGFDSVEFQFTNFQGEVIKGRWLDTFFGLFKLEGSDGFITVKQWKELTGDIIDFYVIY